MTAVLSQIEHFIEDLGVNVTDTWKDTLLDYTLEEIPKFHD